MKLSTNFKFVLVLLTIILFSVGISAQELPQEISSVAPNEWVKGEPLADRIKRNENNGNFIGVIYNYDENDSKFKSDTYNKLGAILVEKAKKYFKVANVELIDLSTIPQVEEKSDFKKYYWYNEYRWWDTKYKTILYLEFKPGKDFDIYQKEDDEVPTGYYSTDFTFFSMLEIFEFYQKKGKEKSKNLTLADPLYLSIRSNLVNSYGRPSMSMRLKAKIPPPDDVVRIIENNLETNLSKWVAKKLDYTITPEIKKPFYQESVVSRTMYEPTKKESFTDKINTIKEGGHAIAVVVEIKDIKGQTTGGEIYHVENPVGLPEKYEVKTIGVDFANHLNESFNTDRLFQLVNTDKLPFGYAWEDTKYKIVIELALSPWYSGKFKYLDGENTYAANFKFKLYVQAKATEYYVENGKPKKSIILSPVDLGTYEAKLYFLTSYPQDITITELESKGNRLVGEALKTEIERLINENYPKLVSKLSK